MGIDLNATSDEALEDPLACSPSSSLSGSPSSSSICLELWHACAGPLISLPRKGGLVVYFPQGHLEQTANYCPKVACDLPPHVFCRVIDVKLHVGFLFFSSSLCLWSAEITLGKSFTLSELGAL